MSTKEELIEILEGDEPEEHDRTDVNARTEPETEAFLQYKYCVVEFLQKPYDNIDPYICVPRSWIKTDGQTGSKMYVAYPTEYLASTRAKVQAAEDFQTEWSFYEAIETFGTNSFSYAEHRIENMNKKSFFLKTIERNKNECLGTETNDCEADTNANIESLDQNVPLNLQVSSKIEDKLLENKGSIQTQLQTQFKTKEDIPSKQSCKINNTVPTSKASSSLSESLDNGAEKQSLLTEINIGSSNEDSIDLIIIDEDNIENTKCNKNNTDGKTSLNPNDQPTQSLQHSNEQKLSPLHDNNSDQERHEAIARKDSDPDTNGETENSHKKYPSNPMLTSQIKDKSFKNIANVQMKQHQKQTISSVTQEIIKNSSPAIHTTEPASETRNCERKSLDDAGEKELSPMDIIDNDSFIQRDQCVIEVTGCSQKNHKDKNTSSNSTNQYSQPLGHSNEGKLSLIPENNLEYERQKSIFEESKKLNQSESITGSNSSFKNSNSSNTDSNADRLPPFSKNFEQPSTGAKPDIIKNNQISIQNIASNLIIPDIKQKPNNKNIPLKSQGKRKSVPKQKTLKTLTKINTTALQSDVPNNYSRPTACSQINTYNTFSSNPINQRTQSLLGTNRENLSQVHPHFHNIMDMAERYSQIPGVMNNAVLRFGPPIDTMNSCNLQNSLIHPYTSVYSNTNRALQNNLRFLPPNSNLQSSLTPTIGSDVDQRGSIQTNTKNIIPTMQNYTNATSISPRTEKLTNEQHIFTVNGPSIYQNPNERLIRIKSSMNPNYERSFPQLNTNNAPTPAQYLNNMTQYNENSTHQEPSRQKIQGRSFTETPHVDQKARTKIQCTPVRLDTANLTNQPYQSSENIHQNLCSQEKTDRESSVMSSMHQSIHHQNAHITSPVPYVSKGFAKDNPLKITFKKVPEKTSIDIPPFPSQNEPNVVNHISEPLHNNESPSDHKNCRHQGLLFQDINREMQQRFRTQTNLSDFRNISNSSNNSSSLYSQGKHFSPTCNTSYQRPQPHDTFGDISSGKRLHRPLENGPNTFQTDSCTNQSFKDLNNDQFKEVLFEKSSTKKFLPIGVLKDFSNYEHKTSESNTLNKTPIQTSSTAFQMVDIQSIAEQTLIKVLGGLFEKMQLSIPKLLLIGEQNKECNETIQTFFKTMNAFLEVTSDASQLKNADASISRDIHPSTSKSSNATTTNDTRESKSKSTTLTINDQIQTKPNSRTKNYNIYNEVKGNISDDSSSSTSSISSTTTLTMSSDEEDKVYEPPKKKRGRKQ